MNSAFRRFRQDLAKGLAAYGFVADDDAVVFRLGSASGDIVALDLQVSHHSSRDERVFYLNVGLALRAQWEFRRLRQGLPDDALPRGTDGVWRHRIASGGLVGDQQWTLAEESTELLGRVLEKELPDLVRMLDREWLWAVARERFLATGWEMRAWILAERGPSAELDGLIDDWGTALAADTLHLLAMSVWLGGLAILTSRVLVGHQPATEVSSSLSVRSGRRPRPVRGGAMWSSTST